MQRTKRAPRRRHFTIVFQATVCSSSFSKGLYLEPLPISPMSLSTRLRLLNPNRGEVHFLEHDIEMIKRCCRIFFENKCVGTIKLFLKLETDSLMNEFFWQILRGWDVDVLKRTWNINHGSNGKLKGDGVSNTNCLFGDL